MAGIILGLVGAIIACVNPKNEGYRYGAFFLIGTLVGVPLFGMGMICMYYQFLSDGLPHVMSIPAVAMIIGLFVAIKMLDFRSKALWWIFNLPYIFFIYGIPIAIFNIIYIYAFYKPKPAPSENPPSLNPTQA